MPSNNQWRQPATRIVINGTPVFGVIDAEVVSSNRFAADRFNAVLALGADPIATAQFWSDTAPLLVAISFSTDGIYFEELIRGYVDLISLDLPRQRVRIEGRDLTSVFLDTRLAQTFPNQTSSDVATSLAASHGLLSSVTATSTPIGRYYQNEHSAVSLDSFSKVATEWDFLVFLARRESFNLWMSGNTLNFNPAPVLPSCIIQPTDTIGMRLERCVTLSRQIAVTVKSWNSSQATTNVAVAQSTGSQQSGVGQESGVEPLNFVLLRPNLTIDQAQQLAQRRLAELVQHECTLDITMPGDISLSAQDLVGILGTGTGFDQTYRIDEIERSVGLTGFCQKLRLVAIPAQSM